MDKIFKTQLLKEVAEALTKAFGEARYTEFFSKMKAAADAKEDTGTFRMIISTDEMDRQGETVDQSGYDLENYMKHPVVLMNHDYYNGLPVGITDRIIREGNQTIAEGRFAPTAEAQELRKYYEAGFPIAASVGFIPREGENGVITLAELLEWSFVKVPANAGCVPADAARAAGINIAYMTTKGFEFVAKTEEVKPKGAEAGSPCEMDDGAPGVFAVDPYDTTGPLICVPVEEKKKDAADEENKPQNSDDEGGTDEPNAQEAEDDLQSELEKEHSKHLEEVTKAVDAMAEGMKADAEKALDPEHKKAKAVVKAEHDRHVKSVEESVKVYTDCMKGLVADPEAEKTLAEIVKAVAGEKLTEKEVLEISMKAGRKLSAANLAKLKDLAQKFEDGHAAHAEGSSTHQKAIDELKAFVESAKPADGAEDGKGADPEQRSISVQTTDGKDIKLGLKEFLMIREVTRTLNAATVEALTLFNEKMKGVRARSDS